MRVLKKCLLSFCEFKRNLFPVPSPLGRYHIVSLWLGEQSMTILQYHFCPRYSQLAWSHGGVGKNCLNRFISSPYYTCSSKIMDIDWIYRCLKVLCESTYLKIHQLCVIILALTFLASIFKDDVWTSAEQSYNFFSIQVFFFSQECEWGFTHLPDFFVSEIKKRGKPGDKAFFLFSCFFSLVPGFLSFSYIRYLLSDTGKSSTSPFLKDHLNFSATFELYKHFKVEEDV